MQIAIVLYPRITALDAVGPYEILQRVPNAELVFVGERRGEVRSDTGLLGLTVDRTLDEVTSPDVVLVPGGSGGFELPEGGALHTWLRAVDETSTWTASVCTGALILAAAGLLKGRRAATHWLAVEELEARGVTHVPERFVRDGKYMTSAGVSAGIDMALALAEQLSGPMTAKMIQLATEYDPHPPFDAGSPQTAPRRVRELLWARRETVMRS
ncbi:DJ-1/PfpI family protein [Dactylosporangium matsuzakiense]|uniref:Glutamine amidotransferase n=1 Tax=Dactylosporangium matsuzakiense TaxID=53360 RepID=A0A9W6KSF1_9ACTN|nr:DJ-1/PfpI family protein [Dactylosporangium matsuzakiense]UWZ48540.1 DJ-1/PfpI family protein [Dactylosporangium matsuzakiense]GLL06367.1 glutamine amidotransferase [Dactylosporangium matsuzakiense]